jgi:hypothetical protein
MKRCPQCEFIYEDDQSLCDMDGVLLVFDARTLPNVHALATVSAPMPETRPRRNRMVPAFATLLLMLSIASVYYVSTMRNTAPPDFTPASVITEAPAVIPPAPSPAAEETVAAVEETPKEEPPRETHTSTAPAAKPAAEPARKATTAKPAATKTEPEPKKDGSKVGSILKKTGKILKKPFKF